MPTIEFANLTIHYREAGKGGALLLFPDNLLAAEAYQEELKHFGKTFHAIAFDYPGNGKSDRKNLYRDEIEYDYWGFRADLACHLLLELKIDSCSTIGSGGGALAALQFAGKQAPQHKITTRGLIADSFLADWDQRKLHRYLDVREHYQVRNGQLLEKIHGEDWNNVVDQDTNWLRRIADRGGYQVTDQVLNRITCPTLLTGHLEDHTLPGLAAEYARISSLIPNCSIYLSSQSNHPYLERPFMWSDPEAFRFIADRYFLNIY